MHAHVYVILYLYIFSDVCKMFDLNKIEPLYINYIYVNFYIFLIDNFFITIKHYDKR